MNMKSIPNMYGGHWFTDEMIRQAKQNAEQIGWAKDRKKRILKKADQVLEKGASFYWHAIASQSIPRTIHTNFESECPNCGNQMTQKYGSYSWICHTDELQWEIQCPNCDVVLPSNDFKAFYESGLDEYGLFDPNAADRSLLVNTKYPDKGSDTWVDDGMGWTAPDGRVYAFVAYYHHYGLWCRSSDPNSALVLTALQDVTDAFLLTSDERYATIGLVILDRLADVYPDMHLEEYADWPGYYNSCGGRKKGKIIGSIWEWRILDVALKAVDAFIPCISKTGIVKTLQAIYKDKGYALKKPDESVIKEHIYKNIVRQVYRGVMNFEICGNTGYHQSMLALAAVVAGKSEEADEWIHTIFATNLEGKKSKHSGGIWSILASRVNADGFGDEASPSYNRIWLTRLFEIAKILKKYPNLHPDYDLFAHPRFQKMAESYIPIPINGEYLPAIGDIGACGNPGTGDLACVMADLYRHFGDPKMAYSAWILNGQSSEGLIRDPFIKNPEKWEQQLEAHAKTTRDPNPFGTALPAYGFAKLCCFDTLDEYKHRPCMGIYFGSNRGHGHYDTLNMMYYQHRLNLMPDLGYPEFATRYPRRAEWTHNVISHNTVASDKDQIGHAGGDLLGFYATQTAGYIGASGRPAYPHLSRYERHVALICCGRARSYVVDFFDVEGGSEHEYSIHGGKGEVSTHEHAVIEQEGGSYAGKNIPYGVTPNHDPKKPYRGFDGIGRHYLKDVKRIDVQQSPLTVTWHVQDHRGVSEGESESVALDARILGDFDEASLATGVPPRNKPGTIPALTYLLLKKRGAACRFMSVLSSHRHDDFIHEVKRLDIEPLNKEAVGAHSCAIRIVHRDKTCDTVWMSDTFGAKAKTEDGLIVSGRYALIRKVDQTITYLQAYGGTMVGEEKALLINRPTGVIEGEICDFSDGFVERAHLTIRTDADFLFTGDFESDHRYVFVEKPNGRTDAYRIFDAKRTHDEIRFDIGQAFAVTAMNDPSDLHGDVVCDLEKGWRAYVPLGCTKTKESQA